MKKQNFARLFIILSILGISTTLLADNDNFEFGGPQGHGKMRFGPGMHGNERMAPPPMLLNPVILQQLLNDIGVDKAAADKIMTISRNFTKSLDERMIRVQREELNIKEELLKDKPDLQVLQSLVNKKTQIFAEIEFAQIKRDIEIKSLLTDQEYDRWKAAMIEKMHPMMPMMPECNKPGEKKTK